MPRLISPTKGLLWKGSLDMEKEDKNNVDHQTYTFLDRADINIVLVEDPISHKYQSYFISRGVLQPFNICNIDCRDLTSIKATSSQGGYYSLSTYATSIAEIS
ncbi:Uncharacterized protein Rs2_14993 [Raphanus sativus]|nr:Uncharacterized protein Rs2_14993 [Raphanus sativus]